MSTDVVQYFLFMFDHMNDWLFVCLFVCFFLSVCIRTEFTPWFIGCTYVQPVHLIADSFQACRSVFFKRPLLARDRAAILSFKQKIECTVIVVCIWYRYLCISVSSCEQRWMKDDFKAVPEKHDASFVYVFFIEAQQVLSKISWLLGSNSYLSVSSLLWIRFAREVQELRR